VLSSRSPLAAVLWAALNISTVRAESCQSTDPRISFMRKLRRPVKGARAERARTREAIRRL